MEDFFGSPDDEVEKAEGFTGEVGGGGFFWILCDGPCALEMGGMKDNLYLYLHRKSPRAQSKDNLCNMQ